MGNSDAYLNYVWDYKYLSCTRMLVTDWTILRKMCKICTWDLRSESSVLIFHEELTKCAQIQGNPNVSPK